MSPVNLTPSSSLSINNNSMDNNCSVINRSSFTLPLAEEENDELSFAFVDWLDISEFDILELLKPHDSTALDNPHDSTAPDNLHDSRAPDMSQTHFQARPESLPPPPELPMTTEVPKAPTMPSNSNITMSLGEQTNTEQSRAAVDEEKEEAKKRERHFRAKPRKRNRKKELEERYVFKTRSNIEHLDDGYRWRKYGLHSIKNSPHPRSYLRCCYPGCEVKKRVERSTEDPSIVVTTYEGKHIHGPSLLPRDIFGNSSRSSKYAYAANSPSSLLPQANYQTQPPPYVFNSWSPPRNGSNFSNLIDYTLPFAVSAYQDGAFGPSSSSSFAQSSSSWAPDNGLHGDMFPPYMQGFPYY